MYYIEELDSLNTLIEVVIKLDNKFYKLNIEMGYKKLSNKIRLYFEYASYYSKKI